jgi:hypothetical protein
MALACQVAQDYRGESVNSSFGNAGAMFDIPKA